MVDQNETKAAQAAEEKTEGAPAGAPSAEAPQSAAPATAQDADELTDAVLEAEAAAIVDNAMDQVEAEAAAAAQVAEWKDKYMRLHAEWDTYRRRTKEQREEEKARAAEKLVVSLLPVIDDLERTIDYAEKNSDADTSSGLLDGVKAVLTKFVDTLQKDGVEVLDPVGQAFDALEAQAVGTVDDPSQPDETVNEVYQKGYKMGVKVLRPAMVTVTTGGPKREKPEGKED